MSPIQFDPGVGTGPKPSSSIRLSRPVSALRHAEHRTSMLLLVILCAVVGAPSAAHGQTRADLLRRVGESTAESSNRTDSPPVVGDVILEMEFVVGGRDSRLLRSSEVDLTVVGEDSVVVRDELVSLTLLRRPAFPPGGTGVALPWSEARALLGQVLAHRGQMAETLPSLLHAVETDGGTVYVPQPFVTFIRPGLEGPLVTVPSGSQNPFDIWELPPLRGGALPVPGTTPAGSEVPDDGATPRATLLWNRDTRRKLYAEAALRAVALDEAKRYDQSLVGVLASSRSEAPTLLGVADAVVSAGLDVENVVSSGQGRMSGSWVGRSARVLGVLALGADFAQRFADERSRNRILAVAADDARIILGLENAQRLLAATGGDPAMIDGLSDAVETLIELSRSRFEQTAAAAADAFVGSIPALAQVAASYVVSGGAALVFQQMGALVAELDDYGHAVLAVSAMTTMGEALRNRVASLLSGNQDGNLRPTDYAVRELVGLQQRLAAEATASVYSMLWWDRWSGATSLGGIGRGIGLTLAEWFTGGAHTREGFEAAMGRRVGQVRTAAMFEAYLPDTLADLRQLYAGPMDAAEEELATGAGGDIELAWKFEAGTGLVYRLSTDVETELPEGMGTLTVEMDFTVHWYVLEVDSAGDATVRVTVERVRMNVDGPMGTMSADSANEARSGSSLGAIRAIAGIRYSVVLDPHGTIVRIFGVEEAREMLRKTADPSIQAMVGQLLSEETLRQWAQGGQKLPEGPVGVGFAWETTDEVSASPFGSMTVVSSHEVESVDGDIAVIGSAANLSPNSFPSAMSGIPVRVGQMVSASTSRFDTRRGLLVDSRSTTTVQVIAEAGRENGVIDTSTTLRVELLSGPTDEVGPESRVPDEIQARSTNCTGWGTPEFFSHAEPADIDRCIQHGADPNARVSIPWDEGFTLDGVTMLHLAAMQSDHAGVIRALLEGGAQSDVRVDGDYEATPLHWAAEYSDNPAVVRVFLEGGADVGVRNETGRTPLHLAVWGAARPDVVRMLLAGGADPNAGDEFVDTPLHLAVAWSDEPRVIVEALLENGADPNARGRYGQTPLHEAVSFEEFSHSAQGRRDPAVVIRLLDAGASIHARTVSGWTPLHTAASTQGHRYVREIIETLLDRGADPAEVNSNGQTAADLAEDNPELRGTSVHARLRRGASE